MKTVFFTIATNNILRIASSKDYPIGKEVAEGLNHLIDMTRDANGKRPELSLEDFEFIHQHLRVSLFFENDQSEGVNNLVLPLRDFRKWIVWNGKAIWHNQQQGVLAWAETFAEEVNTSCVREYLNDICMGRVCYKQAEFTIHSEE
jgi:hypothetical protein